MCVTCGCSETDQVAIVDAATGDQRMMSHEAAHAHGHAHAHDEHSDHGHSHSYDGSAAVMAKAHRRTIDLEQEILGKNQLIAERNRGWLAAKRIRSRLIPTFQYFCACMKASGSSNSERRKRM